MFQNYKAVPIAAAFIILAAAASAHDAPEHMTFHAGAALGRQASVGLVWSF